MHNADLFDTWWVQGKDQPNAITGSRARELWASFGIPQDTLRQLWGLADLDGDGALNMAEHRLAMHLVSMLRAGNYRCHEWLN